MPMCFFLCSEVHLIFIKLLDFYYLYHCTKNCFWYHYDINNICTTTKTATTTATSDTTALDTNLQILTSIPENW